ncbi:MAG TPA: glycosyltransferase [candidate division CPR3 bacterium]|uniref:Glycosyltransferase n=1 Tax=candidate division CPR3 bacterium TaxID=2268181 RepID=A0A7C1S9D2_UNCC3|nr:glycosyltransferase [candidate division CPR3 bacterium]
MFLGNKGVTPLFTVNMPAFNQAKNLPLIFYALTLQAFEDFEVIVIDDGSSDNTKEVVEEWKKKVKYPLRYFWQEDKGNRLPAAENIGLKHAKGKYLININADIIPAPFFKFSLAGQVFPWFGMLVTYAKYVDEDTVLAGVRHEVRREIVDEMELEEIKDFFVLEKYFAGTDYRAQILPELEKAYPPWYLVSGNNMCIPVKALKAVNGWDGDIEGYGYDDWILCCKLYHLGLRFKGLTSAVGYHIQHREGGTLGEQASQVGLERLRMYEKKYGY